MSCCFPFQAQGRVTKAVVGQGVEDSWCLVPLQRKKSHHSSCCSTWLFFFFPLKEQRGKWSSPQRRLLSEVTTPQSCSTQVSLCLCLALGASVPDPMGGVAGWWGGLCRGLLRLVSQHKSPKTLPCAGFGSHAGKPISSHSPGTTQSRFTAQWLRPAYRVPSPLGDDANPVPVAMGAPGRALVRGSSAPA